MWTTKKKIKKIKKKKKKCMFQDVFKNRLKKIDFENGF